MLTRAFLLFAVMFPFLTKGQTPPKLLVDSVQTNLLNDTLLLYQAGVNDTIRYDFQLKNVGGSGATGLVDIMVEYDGDSAVPVMTFPIDLESGEVLDTSFTDSLLSHPNDARYDGGVNIILIWPRAEPDIRADPPDKTLQKVFIDNYVNRVKPQDILNRVGLYPNPVRDELYISYKKANSTLEYVRIYDLYGEQVYYREQPVTAISMSNYPAGIYFVDFRYRDGVKGVFKIVVQQ